MRKNIARDEIEYDADGYFNRNIYSFCRFET